MGQLKQRKILLTRVEFQWSFCISHFSSSRDHWASLSSWHPLPKVVAKGTGISVPYPMVSPWPLFLAWIHFTPSFLNTLLSFLDLHFFFCPGLAFYEFLPRRGPSAAVLSNSWWFFPGGTQFLLQPHLQIELCSLWHSGCLISTPNILA